MLWRVDRLDVVINPGTPEFEKLFYSVIKWKFNQGGDRFGDNTKFASCRW